MNAPIRQTSTLAVVSLVFGILGWTLLPFLGSLVAVVCGHMARGEIRRAQGNLEGGGRGGAGRGGGVGGLGGWPGGGVGAFWGGARAAARGQRWAGPHAPPPDWCWATS